MPIIDSNEYGPWHTPETARAEWTDAENLDDTILRELLTVARMQVEAFAPPFLTMEREGPWSTTPVVPVNVRMAQLMQARNLWNATTVAPNGDFGSDTYVVQPRPMDWHVKALLRPARGKPVAR